jgi:hypothetical protein
MSILTDWQSVADLVDARVKDSADKKGPGISAEPFSNP